MPIQRKNIVRALIRLLFLLIITSYHILRYVIVGMFKRFSRIHATTSTQLWSKHLVACSGISVIADGSIPPQGALLISNHRSYIDIAVIGSFLPCTFLSKAEVAKWPVVGLAARVAQVLFVQRNDPESRKRSRIDIAEALNAGISVIIFPEGTSFDGPSILPFKKGVFQIAAEAGFNVVPVAIEYADINDAWVGDDSFISHFLKTFAKKHITCSVSFGPLLQNPDPDDLCTCCQDWIKQQLSSMQQKIR